MGDMFRLSISHHLAFLSLYKIQILDLFQMCNGIPLALHLSSLDLVFLYILMA